MTTRGTLDTMQVQSKPSIVENLVASKLCTIEGLCTTEGLVYGDYYAILSTRHFHMTSLFVAQLLVTVFATTWLLTSVVLFM